MLTKEYIQKKINFHANRYEKALAKNNLDSAEFHSEELYAWQMRKHELNG